MPSSCHLSVEQDNPSSRAICLHRPVSWLDQWERPRTAAPRPLPRCPLAWKGATCYWDTEEMAALTSVLPVEWLGLIIRVRGEGRGGGDPTTRPPLRPPPSTQMTTFSSLEGAGPFREVTMCWLNREKLNHSIPIPMLACWQFRMLFGKRNNYFVAVVVPNRNKTMFTQTWMFSCMHLYALMVMPFVDFFLANWLLYNSIIVLL